MESYQRVDSPKELFRKVDATQIEDNSFEFSVADSAEESTLGQEFSDSLAVEKRTVVFEDLSDPFTDVSTALETIREAAETVDRDEIPDRMDTAFETSESGEGVTYFCNTEKMGYEVVRNESDPRLAGYVVIDPDQIVRVVG